MFLNRFNVASFNNVAAAVPGTATSPCPDVNFNPAGITISVLSTEMNAASNVMLHQP